MFHVRHLHAPTLNNSSINTIRGGGTAHEYNNESDCKTLNTLTTLVEEGMHVSYLILSYVTYREIYVLSQKLATTSIRKLNFCTRFQSKTIENKDPALILKSLRKRWHNKIKHMEMQMDNDAAESRRMLGNKADKLFIKFELLNDEVSRLKVSI